MIHLNESSDNALSSTQGSLFAQHTSLHILLGQWVCGEATWQNPPYWVVWQGRLPPAGTDGVNYPSFRANSFPLPYAVVLRGQRGVQGECVVVRRKVRFCCFFAGNRLVRESSADVHKIDHSGGWWRGNVSGCASATLLMIGLLLMARTLHTLYWRDRRKKITNFLKTNIFSI